MRATWSRRRQVLQRAWRIHRPARVGRVRAGALVVALVAAAGAAYTVRGGDTLSGIALRHGVSVGELAEANHISDPDRIFVGQTLRIPGSGSSSSSGGSSSSGSVGSARTHVVAPGESLGTIARRYGLDLRDLARANGITNPNRLMAGVLLRVASTAPPAPGTSTGGGSAGTYRIQRGDALSTIARRVGASVTSLVRANGLASADRIYAGQTLKVPGGSGGGGSARWSCVVPGGRYVNDFGIAKPSGRHHEGIDVHAPRGTVVRAPVAGTIRYVNGPRGGLQFSLKGADGYTYIGSHMDSYGSNGRVQKGEAIGTVGTTGNARGTSPHLHFEMHHGSVVNPHPTLQKYC